MKKIIILVFTSLISIHLVAQEFTEGIWFTGEDNTKIETYKKEETWYGKIISSDNPKAQIGKDILINFKKEDNEWKGKLFAAKRGKNLDAVIIPGFSKLKITVSAGLFKKKLSWERIQSQLLIQE